MEDSKTRSGRSLSPSKSTKIKTEENIKPLTDKRKSNYISKNIEKLKKKQINSDMPNIDIDKIIEEELPNKPEKETTSLKKSPVRPSIKTKSQTTKITENKLTNQFINLQIKDSNIEILLKEEEKTSEKNSDLSNSPPKPEEKKRSSSKNPEISNEIITSLKSQEFLSNKFIKEFKESNSRINSFSDSIDLVSTKALLTDLKFVKQGQLKDSEENLIAKLWKLANGQESIKVQDLLCICLNIMNLYSPLGHFSSSEINIKSWSFLNGIYIYNSEEALKIHKTFYEFYQNRRLAPKKTKENLDSIKECSFRPQVNKLSHTFSRENRARCGSVGIKKREESLNRRIADQDKPPDIIIKKKEQKEIRPNMSRSPSKPRKTENSVQVNKKVPIVRKEFYDITESPPPRLKKNIIEARNQLKDTQSLSLVVDFKEIIEDSSNKNHDFEQSSSKEKTEIIAEIEARLNADFNVPALPEKNSCLILETSSLNKEDKTEPSPSTNEKGSNLTLQLLNFINDYNLSEDSAEKLLQIFQLSSKSNSK